MDVDFLIVDNHVTANGDVTEFKHCDGKLLVKHFAGINTDNFIVKKINGKQMEFSFFKINNVYYVNINGHHIIDYKKFVIIKRISNVDSDVKIQNAYIGDIVLTNCDVDIVKKSLDVMAKWMKNKSWWWSNLLYHIFH
jgi:hypothetical protein